MRDIERAVGRLSQVSGNARDLVALRTSLEQIPELKRQLRNADRARRSLGWMARTMRACLREVDDELREMPELLRTAERALVEDPPFVLKDGGIFQDGFDAGSG